MLGGFHLYKECHASYGLAHHAILPPKQQLQHVSPHGNCSEADTVKLCIHNIFCALWWYGLEAKTI